MADLGADPFLPLAPRVGVPYHTRPRWRRWYSRGTAERITTPSHVRGVCAHSYRPQFDITAMLGCIYIGAESSAISDSERERLISSA